MNANRNDMRTPFKRAAGLGAAKDGTGHFLWQRLTAVAVLLAGLYLLGILFALRGADYDMARGLLSDPLNAGVLVLFLLAAFWHARLGLQVIIEDYVHAPVLAALAHVANILVCALAAIVGVVAVLRIAVLGV